jgi:hypothetical protein|uniref:Uncharacterized protein n=1 Tax=Desulfobacca acetoxidans TaxID=60893 RepID=A0A7C3SI91_9BACT
MKDRRKKGKKNHQALKPLSPEAAVQLQAQVARVQEALASGQGPEEAKSAVTPRTDDLLWDLHLIASLSRIRHNAVPLILAALFGPSPDKERRKALKRALHLLKTRGVPVPEDILPREEAPAGSAAPAPQALAYVSPIFGNGERYVILEGPREFLGGNLLVVRLSDTAGFQECLLLSLKRRQREEFWKSFQEQGLSRFAQPPASYSVRLLEDAFELNPRREAATRYAAWRTAVWQHWGLPLAEEEMARRFPPLSEPEANLYLERARELARSDLFQSWLPSLEEIRPWVRKVREAEESPLILAEYQQRARYDQIVEEAVLALYPPESRALLGRRLLEMAYFLELIGRSEEARAAQAAGEDLKASVVSPLKRENPFLVGLVMYALRLGLEYDKQTEAQVSPDLVTATGKPLIIGR